MARAASTYRGERRNQMRAERVVLRSDSRHISRVRLGRAPKFYTPHQGARECARRRRQMGMLGATMLTGIGA